MKQKIAFFFCALAFMMMAIAPAPVQAQEPAAYVFDTTKPVNAGVRAAVDAWLAVSPPANATYYAITYTDARDLDTFVSLAALNIQSPDEEWFITEKADGTTQVIWLGSVLVHYDNSVELLTPAQAQVSVPKVLALPANLSGGGHQYRFPWDYGKSVKYSIAGPHALGYEGAGLNGVAVDLISGDNMGLTAATDKVFAAGPGIIDFVCDDGTSVAIRTSGVDTDQFMYAHLNSNANLVVDHEFEKGALIGNLRSGTFLDSCGWAVQSGHHYHLHWGIWPSAGTFRVGGCVLNTSVLGKWTCGTTVVSPGQMLANIETDTLPGADDGGMIETPTPSFWNMFLVGFVTIFDQGVVKLLPSHTSATALPMALWSAVRFVFKVTYALLRANFNMGPAMAALFIALAFRFLISVIWVIAAIFRTWKMLPMQ